MSNMGVAIPHDKHHLHFGAGQTVAVCHDRQKPWLWRKSNLSGAPIPIEV
jgi:hypothetical protein